MKQTPRRGHAPDDGRNAGRHVGGRGGTYGRAGAAGGQVIRAAIYQDYEGESQLIHGGMHAHGSRRGIAGGGTACENGVAEPSRMLGAPDGRIEIIGGGRGGARATGRDVM